jgi:hypothetical protein
MPTFSDSVIEYRKQLGRGQIQEAYRGLMEYMNELRAHFAWNLPDYDVSSSLYFGYMDMTYFAVVPPSLKNRKLKIAIVLVHETTSFEVWLAGANRQVQAEYWELLKDKNWGNYRLRSPAKGVDAILEYALAPAPDFSDLNSLTGQIVAGTLKFVSDVEAVLSS